MDSSNAASSSSSAPPAPRPQAGPLPVKRGEIGFTEEVRDAEEGRSSSPAVALPERHPEDRGASAPAADATAAPNPTAASSPSLTTLATTSTDSLRKKKHLFGFLKPKKVPSYYGLRLTTLLACIGQFCLMAGTIVGWYFTASRVGNMESNANSSSQQQQSNNQNNGQNNGQSTSSFGGASTTIFIHVVFGVVTLVQLLFIERRIFRLRAQRYSYLHPGEILPSARRRAMGDPSLAFAPWSRPPLPTYAAALAQSGVGTGDVEDHLIAAPPPPAYGNTRGSTFLLSGFLRASLLAERPASVHSTSSQDERRTSQRSGRPVSYKSVDEDWEEIQDADRARMLEETLARLEQPAPAVTR